MCLHPQDQSEGKGDQMPFFSIDVGSPGMRNTCGNQCPLTLPRSNVQGGHVVSQERSETWSLVGIKK